MPQVARDCLLEDITVLLGRPDEHRETHDVRRKTQSKSDYTSSIVIIGGEV